MSNATGKVMVGALEVCDLPELQVSGLEMRVDTGAQTSSLHVDNIEPFRRGGEQWLRFDIHPDVHNVEEVVRREARVQAVRWVKSSSGHRQKRYMIEMQFRIAGMTWPILVTLSDRTDMTYLMLLGREAMTGRLTVDPEHEFLVSEAP